MNFTDDLFAGIGDDNAAGQGRAVVPFVTVLPVDPILRKPVGTLALVSMSSKITVLTRKIWNVLLRRAQAMGIDNAYFQMPLTELVRDMAFSSKDHSHLKNYLEEMVGIRVQWHSPTSAETNSDWNRSALLAGAGVIKRKSQNWIRWSYDPIMKQELLAPTLYAPLSLDVMARLRSGPAVALWEICSRYVNAGRTPRAEWTEWRPWLTGNPEGQGEQDLEYRYFKRDVLRRAIAEVNSSDDIEVELVEHKQGRFVNQLQFLVRGRRDPEAGAQPEQRAKVYELLIDRAIRAGVPARQAATMVARYGDASMATALTELETRAKSAFPEPLRDPVGYLRTLLPKAATRRKAQSRASPQLLLAPPTGPGDNAAPSPQEVATRERTSRLVAVIQSLPQDEVERLGTDFAEDLQRRGLPATFLKVLRTHGWQLKMVVGDMLKFYDGRHQVDGAAST